MNKTVLLISSRDKIAGMFRRIIRSLAFELEVCSDVDAAKKQFDPDRHRVLLASYGPEVPNWDTQQGKIDEFLTRISTDPSVSTHPVLISDSTNKALLLHLLQSPFLHHLVAKTDPPDYRELLVTFSKLFTNDIFGLEKYLPWGVKPRTFIVRRSGEKTLIIDALQLFADSLGISDRLTNVAAGVADEFLMNAIYNAPVRDGAVRPYATLPRTVPVELEKKEAARFQYASDGQYLYMAIRDRFGSLRSKTVIDYLTRCYSKGTDQIEVKAGGAGMGLYMIVESLNKVIINLRERVGTEMIGMMEIVGSYRDYARRPKSFHLFEV